MGIETVAALAGTAASLAGTGVGIAGAKASQDAMEQSVRNQLNQEAQFQQQATPLYQKSLEQSSPENAQRAIQDQAAQTTELYRRLQQTPLSTASPAVQLNPQNTVRTDQAIQGQNAANAQLQGFGQWQIQQWLKNQQANLGLGTIGNLAQSGAANAGTLAQLAGRSGLGLQGAGSLLSSLGGLSSLYGATAARPQTTNSGIPRGQTTSSLDPKQ